MALLCLACGSCNVLNRGQPPQPNPPPPARAVPVTPTTFTEADIDKDGVLSLEEVQTLPKEEPTTFLSAFLYIICAVLAALIVSVVLTKRCRVNGHKNDDDEMSDKEEQLLNETAMLVDPNPPVKTDSKPGDGPSVH